MRCRRGGRRGRTGRGCARRATCRGGAISVGARWFERLCRQRGLDPEAAFHDRVRRYFNGALKPPFNREARDAAGIPASYYEPLAAREHRADQAPTRCEPAG